MRISDCSSDVCSSDLGSVPSTKKAEEPLSATVSAKVIRQSAIRLSTISIAGTVLSMAAMTVSSDASGSSRSRPMVKAISARSEEHTSELQSLMRISYAVFCLKKKKPTINRIKQASTDNSEQIQ